MARQLDWVRKIFRHTPHAGCHVMEALAWCLLLLGGNVESGGVGTNTPDAPVVAGNRWHATSENFVVSNRYPGQDARAVARRCEECRAQLQQHWCANQCPAWTPQCNVVVHPNQSTYLAAVGAGGGPTFASSLIAFGKNKQVSKRQIDVRGDSQLGIDAVPHEMTHVVLADLLDGNQPPRWADEGMAILADSPQKQRLHGRDLQAGMARRLDFRTPELLTLDQYPQASRVPAFYGQSASLTAFLVDRDRPATFVAFLRDARGLGYDAALRKHYQIPDIAELERLWRSHETTTSTKAVATLGSIVRTQAVE